MFVIKNNNEYLSDILKKILNSHSIIENLSDQPNDLELLEIELKKPYIALTSIPLLFIIGLGIPNHDLNIK